MLHPFCREKITYTNAVVATFSGGVALIMWFTTNRMWVKNKTITYVARASNSKRDCEHDLYCYLLPQCETLCTCRSGFPIASLSSGHVLGSIDRWPLEEGIRFCFAGEYLSLVQLMKCERPDHLKTYFRMTPEQFSKLLHIVRVEETYMRRWKTCSDAQVGHVKSETMISTKTNEFVR